ncbi:MAG: SDR family oxidoreductase [Bacteroidetes bacterium]|nr:SDR family oxidoreductase [Bacteroidota bacterium]
MKNYLIIGHSSGIGASLSGMLATQHQVYGTYFSHPVSNNNNHISSHYLTVLDKEPDLSFLPDCLDGLAYCVGAINLKPFARIKEEDFINDYKLQVTGAIKVIQSCLPALKKSDTASIVLFSTVAVTMGFNFHSMVSASKGAVEGLTKALSAELAPSIRVNCIAPSITQTPLAASLLSTPEKIEANAQRHPLKKIGAPADIAGMAAFLLTEASSWITGQVIHIDGGISSIK